MCNYMTAYFVLLIGKIAQLSSNYIRHLHKLQQKFTLFKPGMIYKQSIFLFIADLTNLVELDLSYNFLSSIPVGALSDLNNLKFLNLGSNKIQVKIIL